MPPETGHHIRRIKAPPLAKWYYDSATVIVTAKLQGLVYNELSSILRSVGVSCGVADLLVTHDKMDAIGHHDEEAIFPMLYLKQSKQHF